MDPAAAGAAFNVDASLPIITLAATDAQYYSQAAGRNLITVTFDVYGHLMPGMDEEVAERLEHAWHQASRDETRTMRAPSEVAEIHRA